jgi:hypothetical protein
MIKNPKNIITTKLTFIKENIKVDKKQNNLSSSLSSQIIKKLKSEAIDRCPKITKRNYSNDNKPVGTTRSSFFNSRLVSPANRKISVESTSRKDSYPTYLNISHKLTRDTHKNSFTNNRNSSYERMDNYNNSGDILKLRNVAVSNVDVKNIDSPEELHFVQVKFFQKNKLISNKFG